MRWTIVAAATVALAACSGPVADPTGSAGAAPTRIGAAALVHAYAQDPDEANAAFAGHSLLISGDVARVDRAGHRLLLTTGSSAERLPATVMSSPHPVSPQDLVALRCDRIDRDANGPRVSQCAFIAIIPARIAHGG